MDKREYVKPQFVIIQINTGLMLCASPGAVESIDMFDDKDYDPDIMEIL